MSDERSPTQDRVRFDRWLWAARFYKTRSLATTAVNGGRARLNGKRSKAGVPVRVGDRVTVRKGAFEFDLDVTGVAERRGSAQQAARLYVERPESIALREKRRAEMKIVIVPSYEGKGRPTKKQRRELERLRRQHPDDPHEAS